VNVHGSEMAMRKSEEKPGETDEAGVILEFRMINAY
jgi:hypothetical protein